MLTHGEATREIPLPFILKTKLGKIESYWSVAETADWFENSKLGTEYAFNYMAAAYRKGSPAYDVPPLVCIIADMVKAGADIRGNSIAHSFLCAVANASYETWTPAVLDWWRKREAEREAFIVRHKAERDAEQSARNRQNAITGWAKRRAKNGKGRGKRSARDSLESALAT